MDSMERFEIIYVHHFIKMPGGVYALGLPGVEHER